MYSKWLRRQETTAITGRLADEAEAIGDRHALLGLLAMGVLILRLAKDHPAVDKKLLRQLLDLHTQAGCLICLAIGNLVLQFDSRSSKFNDCLTGHAWRPDAFSKETLLGKIAHVCKNTGKILYALHQASARLITAYSQNPCISLRVIVSGAT